MPVKEYEEACVAGQRQDIFLQGAICKGLNSKFANNKHEDCALKKVELSAKPCKTAAISLEDTRRKISAHGNALWCFRWLKPSLHCDDSRFQSHPDTVHQQLLSSARCPCVLKPPPAGKLDAAILIFSTSPHPAAPPPVRLSLKFLSVLSCQARPMHCS